MIILETLYGQKAVKFAEICSLLTSDLGYGEFSALSEEGRKNVEDEAQQLVDDWEETIEIVVVRTETPFECLLREHHEICESIIDYEADETGLARD